LETTAIFIDAVVCYLQIRKVSLDLPIHKRQISWPQWLKEDSTLASLK
jgi:hypothetical protein